MRDLLGVLQIHPVAGEQRVRLVLDDEGNVCGDLARHLVALLGEGHLGPGLPAWLHNYFQHFVLRRPRSVLSYPLSRDLHLLFTAGGNFFDADKDLLLDGVVLHLGLLPGFCPPWFENLNPPLFPPPPIPPRRSSRSMSMSSGPPLPGPPIPPMPPGIPCPPPLKKDSKGLLFPKN